MGRNKEFDITQVMQKTIEIFGFYGYEGTTLQILTKELGIARQSLYDTFGSKRDLFISAMKYYMNEKTEATVAYLSSSVSKKSAIADVINQCVTVLNNERQRNKCFILQSTVDQVPHDTEVAEFFKQDMARVEQAFYDAVKEAQEKSEITNRHDPLALARFLNNSRYSLTQAAKSNADVEILNSIATVILAALDG